MLPLQAPKHGKYTLAKIMNLISLVQQRFNDHCIVYNHVHNCVLWVSYSAAVYVISVVSVYTATGQHLSSLFACAYYKYSACM